MARPKGSGRGGRAPALPISRGRQSKRPASVWEGRAPCAVIALQGLRHGELESSLARKSPERDRLGITHLAYRDTNNS